LIIGDLSDASDLDDLRRRGVTHILNLRWTELHCWEGFNYLKCPVFDEYDCLRADSIVSAIRFVDLAQRDGGKILVYCREGIDRAPFVAALYLHYFQDMSLEEAYKHVKSMRPQSTPHPEWFTSKLQDEIWKEIWRERS